MSIEAPMVWPNWCHLRNSLCQCIVAAGKWVLDNDEIESFPCKSEQPNWPVGIACLLLQLVPWLVELEAHLLAFEVGKLHLHIHKLGL